MALYRVPTENNAQYTLDATLTAGNTTSLTLNEDVSSVVRAPGVVVIDRVDSSGNVTATKREYISFTGVSTTQLTGLSRGLGGSTDQEHAVSAIVEFVPDVVQENAWYDWGVTEHTTTGVHASLISLSTVKTYTKIDVSGASLLGFPLTPTWVIKGHQSLASTGIGTALTMPRGGSFEFFTLNLAQGQTPASASLLIDINKNGSSILAAGTRLTLLAGATFMSTASINTKTFVSGDRFDVDIDNIGNQVDITVVGYAR